MKVSRQPVVSDVLSTAAKAHFEFIQDGDVSLGGYRLTISIIVLKEKRPDDSLTAHSGPDSYLFRMQLFTDTRFYPILYLLLKSLLWLYFLEYRNQIYRRHMAMDEYKSLKKSDRCGHWFWFYSKNRGFRSFWTGMYITNQEEGRRHLYQRH